MADAVLAFPSAYGRQGNSGRSQATTRRWSPLHARRNDSTKRNYIAYKGLCPHGSRRKFLFLPEECFQKALPLREQSAKSWELCGDKSRVCGRAKKSWRGSLFEAIYGGSEALTPDLRKAKPYSRAGRYDKEDGRRETGDRETTRAGLGAQTNPVPSQALRPSRRTQVLLFGTQHKYATPSRVPPQGDY
jgi:hypothetical protein